MGQAKRIHAIAAACHEVYRAHIEAHTNRAMPAWGDTGDQQRQLAVVAVRAALKGITPAEAHGEWLAQMQSIGWKYGKEVDPGAKEHPLLIPYDELPGPIHEKDNLFCRTVQQLSRVMRC